MWWNPKFERKKKRKLRKDIVVIYIEKRPKLSLFKIGSFSSSFIYLIFTHIFLLYTFRTERFINNSLTLTDPKKTKKKYIKKWIYLFKLSKKVFEMNKKKHCETQICDSVNAKKKTFSKFMMMIFSLALLFVNNRKFQFDERDRFDFFRSI